MNDLLYIMYLFSLVFSLVYMYNLIVFIARDSSWLPLTEGELKCTNGNIARYSFLFLLFYVSEVFVNNLLCAFTPLLSSISSSHQHVKFVLKSYF